MLVFKETSMFLHFQLKILQQTLMCLVALNLHTQTLWKHGRCTLWAINQENLRQKYVKTNYLKKLNENKKGKWSPKPFVEIPL